MPNGVKNSLNMINLSFTKRTLMMGLAYELGPCNLYRSLHEMKPTFIAALHFALHFSQEKIEFLVTWVKLEKG